MSFMSTRDVLDEALRLPADERARIAQELILSLDDEGEGDLADLEAVWAREIEARAARAHRGESTGRDLATVLDELDAKRRR